MSLGSSSGPSLARGASGSALSSMARLILSWWKPVSPTSLHILMTVASEVSLASERRFMLMRTTLEGEERM